jgi:hypothetical protein
MLPKHVCGDTTAAGTCVECNVDIDCDVVGDGGALTCVAHVCQP